MNPQQAIQDAAELAARSDVAVLIVGLSNEWESEGSDRKTLAFPGKQDELIEAVARVCKRVVVVVQAVSHSVPSVSAPCFFFIFECGRLTLTSGLSYRHAVAPVRLCHPPNMVLGERSGYRHSGRFVRHRQPLRKAPPLFPTPTTGRTVLSELRKRERAGILSRGPVCGIQVVSR